MNVLYDIAVLGQGHIRPQHRAGVYRVVEELAYQLAKSPECDLKFFSIDFLLPSLEYLHHNPKLNSVPLPLPSEGNRLGTKLFHLDSAIGQEQSRKNLPLRLQRKLFAFLNSKLGSPLPGHSRQSGKCGCFALSFLSLAGRNTPCWKTETLSYDLRLDSDSSP